MHGIHGYWMKKHNIQIIKIEMIFYAKNDKKLMQIHKIWAKTFFHQTLSIMYKRCFVFILSMCFYFLSIIAPNIKLYSDVQNMFCSHKQTSLSQANIFVTNKHLCLIPHKGSILCHYELLVIKTMNNCKNIEKWYQNLNNISKTMK